MMTRIELLREAHEKVNYCTPYHPESFVQGYIAGAEPREKQLTKAKEIIKTYYEDNFDEAEFYSLRKKAEQFLKEVEGCSNSMHIK